MNIILATYGSRGDVQPCLAFALALKNAGHAILVAGPPEQAEWINSYGCPFRPFGSNLDAWLKDHPISQSLRGAIEFVRFLRTECRNQLTQLQPIINESDLVLVFSVVGGAPTVAESLGVPYGYVALFPPILPSSQYPSVFFKNYSLPGWINRLSWWFTKKIFNFVLKGTINKERRRLGLTPISDVWRHLLGNRVIVASDPILGPVPDDVEIDYKQVGYFHLRQLTELTKEIEEFLTQGPRPLYVGFGSMPEQARETTNLVLEAVRETGQRVILSSGWAQRGNTEAGENCLVVGDVSHPILFPRVAAVVHHGGAGTTATAARAGVPQIIVPHLADQFYWARQIPNLGIGPVSISRSRLTSGRLAAAINEAVSSETMRRRAKEIGEILQKQDSLTQAVKTLETGFFAKTKVI